MTMNTTTDEAPGAGPAGRVEHAFAARESSLYAHALMEGMITQTLAPYLHLPGVAEVLEAGVSPLVDASGSGFRVHRLRGHRTNSVLFASKACMFLYSLGSAASVNTPEGDNAWMRVLCDFIREFRPANLYVANFNRLVRSALWSGELMRAVEEAGTVLWANGIRIDLGDPQGRVLWQTLAMLSDLERESIVQRLFAGTVNKYGRGEWILNAEAVTPGYHLESDRVVLDPNQVDAVRHVIGLLADPQLSARQVVDAAGAAGLTSPTIQRVHGEDATIADVRRADAAVRVLLGHVPVWATGTYEARLPNPYRGATRIGTLPVVDDDPPHARGFVVFTYQLEVPDGGWAEPAVLAAAARRRVARQEALDRGGAANGGAAHRKRRPFSGWAAVTDETGARCYLSGDNARYLVMRQDPDPTKGPGTEEGHDGDDL